MYYSRHDLVAVLKVNETSTLKRKIKRGKTVMPTPNYIFHLFHFLRMFFFFVKKATIPQLPLCALKRIIKMFLIFILYLFSNLYISEKLMLHKCTRS